MPSQLPLFGVPEQSYHANLYQDRAGVYGKSRWIVFGLLFIPPDLETLVINRLKIAREEENCRTPLQFSDLPSSWGGASMHKPRTVYRWLNSSKSLLQNAMCFHAFAVDVQAPFFEHDAFSRQFHVYNRFLRMALTSAIPWFFKGKSSLTLDMCFHNQSFEGYSLRENGRPGKDYDNLSDYIISESERDMDERQDVKPDIWPKVRINKPIIYLPIDPRKVDDSYLHHKCELLQLTDIMVGAVAQAIDGNSTRKTKLELGSVVGEWMSDIRLRPWEQTFGLHRRFGVTYYPDANGRTYSDGPLRLSKRLPGTKQIILFS